MKGNTDTSVYIHVHVDHIRVSLTMPTVYNAPQSTYVYYTGIVHVPYIWKILHALYNLC